MALTPNPTPALVYHSAPWVKSGGSWQHLGLLTGLLEGRQPMLECKEHGGITETQENKKGSRGKLGSRRGEGKVQINLREGSERSERADWATEAEKSDEKDQKGN